MASPNISYSKLILENFQTFADETEIPLGRLTFLFGPNSAGKSAVEDGINAFSSLTKKDQEFSITGIRGYDRIKKYCRRTSGDYFGFANNLSIGLRGQFYDYNNNAWRNAGFDTSKLQALFNNSKLQEITYKNSFEIIYPPEEEGNDGLALCGHCVDINIDDTPILKIDMQRQIGVFLNHPLWVALGCLQDIKSIPESIKSIASIQNGWLYISGGWHVSFSRKIDLRFNESATKQQAHEAALFFAETINNINNLLALLTDLFKTQYSLVEASRTVPSAKDLCFILDSPWETGFYKWQLDGFPLPNIGNKIYKRLAESLINASTPLSPYFDRHINDRGDGNLAEMVNYVMTEHLFIERGYRLGAEYRLMLSPEQFSTTKSKGYEHEAGDFPILVRLFLMDSLGREFSFDEVGSGLGYVIPVLVSLFGEEDVSIIQQPELHLHPALQAAMGDVLIEAVNKGKQVIVETHSEHLLLRVLRRIRQSAKSDTLDENLRISNNDITILYFDPSIEGKTKVKQLRVAPDGEFLDRWPRGFFSERDAELFDE